jgi:hypothetical protein
VSKYTVDWGYYKSDGNAINEWFGDVYSRNLIYDTLSATFINSILDRDSSSSVFLFYSNKTDDPDEYTNGLKKYKVHRTINSLIEDRNHALKSSAYRSIYVFCNPPLSETPKTDTVIPVVETKTETPYQYVANPYFAPKTTGIMTPVTTTTGNYSLKVEMSEEGSFFTWSGFPDNSGYSYDVSLQYTDGNGMNIELLPPTECNDCKEKYDDAIKNRKIVINDFIEKRLQNIGIIFYATVNANNNSGVVASKEYRFNVKHGRTTCLFVLK